MLTAFFEKMTIRHGCCCARKSQRLALQTRARFPRLCQGHEGSNDRQIPYRRRLLSSQIQQKIFCSFIIMKLTALKVPEILRQEPDIRSTSSATRRDEPYIVSPLQMVTTNARCYLIVALVRIALRNFLFALYSGIASRCFSRPLGNIRFSLELGFGNTKNVEDVLIATGCHPSR